MSSTPTDSTGRLDIDYVRSQFPALGGDVVYMDNAGGSQILGSVVERIREYLFSSNVQLGASYRASVTAANRLSATVDLIAAYINAERSEEVIIGPSTTMLLRILSLCLSSQWEAGDEIVVSNADHEANVSCWTDLERRGFVVKTWHINPETLEFDLDDLDSLLTTKTRLVALVHVSNILGTFHPVRTIARMVHQAGALFCVDGVAYAPHRLVDVQDFGADFYAFSFYKVYGPHLAVLYGKYELLREMDGINHSFITKEDVPYKFQPGGPNYELMYGLSAIPEYFSDIGPVSRTAFGLTDRHQKWSSSFDLIADHEQELAAALLDYLNSRTDVRIVGKTTAAASERVPTISFAHDRLRSSEIVTAIDSFGIGIRYGDFYAKRLIRHLGLVDMDGVVRVSMVHYNTLDEVARLVDAFEKTLGSNGSFAV